MIDDCKGSPLNEVCDAMKNLEKSQKKPTAAKNCICCNAPSHSSASNLKR